MPITAIVAMAENRAIGKDNKLLWHLPDDLMHFKQLTLNNPIIMGRKTYEAIGRALPSRTNIVLTRDAEFSADGCIIAHTPEDAITAATPAKEIFVIGGETIYTQFLPRTTRIYLTLVEGVFEGDAFFPELNPLEWEITENIHHPADARHKVAFHFKTLDRAR